MDNPGSTLADFHDRHKPAHDRAQIAEAVADINNRINGCGFYFCWDKEADGSYTSYEELPEHSVMVLSSFDFSYYYDLELTFHDAIKHTLPDDNIWPDHWEKDQLVLMPEVDAVRFMHDNGLPYDFSYHLFAFNRGSHSDETYLILAKGFSYHFGTVFYYNRLAQEPLKEFQRVAWWISR